MTHPSHRHQHLHDQQDQHRRPEFFDQVCGMTILAMREMLPGGWPAA